MQSFHTKDISQNNFLVTGGAGFIGGHIAEYLLKNGAGKVRVLDNMVNGFEKNLDVLRNYSAFEFLEGDIRNEAICQEACTGIDYISHQAALGSVPRSIKEPVYFNEVNVGGFVNMLKAAVDNNVKQFVYASSSSVYGDEPTLPKQENRVGNCLSPYAATKKTNEQIEGIVDYFLEAVGIPHAKFLFPDEISGGMQKRVGIARAVVNKPVLIIADEPTGNLDPELSAEIMLLFEQFQQVGATILIASHDISLISQMNHRLLKLDHGQLV